MLLDDALSAVDTETDAAIRHGLSQRLDRTTVLITSHRISTLMTSDLIILLENGKITEQGTHQQLLAQDGAYAKICRIQMMLPEEICHEG